MNHSGISGSATKRLPVKTPTVRGRAIAQLIPAGYTEVEQPRSRTRGRGACGPTGTKASARPASGTGCSRLREECRWNGLPSRSAPRRWRACTPRCRIPGRTPPRWLACPRRGKARLRPWSPRPVPAIAQRAEEPCAPPHAIGRRARGVGSHRSETQRAWPSFCLGDRKTRPRLRPVAADCGEVRTRSHGAAQGNRTGLAPLNPHAHDRGDRSARITHRHPPQAHRRLDQRTQLTTNAPRGPDATDPRP